jgi:hypothetical protein
MANKILFFLVLFISAVSLVNIPGACLAQPADNTKINKQDTSPKELTADQQGETKQDRKIRSVQGLKILEPKLSGFSKKNPTRSAADCGMYLNGFGKTQPLLGKRRLTPTDLKDAEANLRW